jgi:hypothetical protein
MMMMMMMMMFAGSVETWDYSPHCECHGTQPATVATPIAFGEVLSRNEVVL